VTVFLDTSTILAACWSSKGLSRILVTYAPKDKPVILSAIGCNADYLVTSDTTDFAHILSTVVYGVKVRTPKSFLQEMGVVG
jgi:predicted nucleic acid-binding protein